MAPTFFEGPEKKVELVVHAGEPSLRSHGDARWRAVVDAAGAKVVSVVNSERCDAYLLSESSLLVFDDYLVMITCGRTTLVDAVEEMLRFIPKAGVALLVYERKNENFPDQQSTTFFDDARRLSRLIDGRALRFGGEYGHCIHMFHSTQPFVPESKDPTLEILMHGISQDVLRTFEDYRQASSLARSLGLDRIFPDFHLDEYAFAPAGYSLNGLRGDEYFTVHVTPEMVGSYVSLETNYNFRGGLSALVSHVTEIFTPCSFDVVTFLPETYTDLSVDGYLLGDHVREALGGYHVSFYHYLRPADAPRPAYLVSDG